MTCGVCGLWCAAVFCGLSCGVCSLLIVVRRLLLVVCWFRILLVPIMLLLVVCCVLGVAFCVLPAAGHSLFVNVLFAARRCVLGVVCCLLFVVWCVLFKVSFAVRRFVGWLLTVWCLFACRSLFDVCCFVFDVWCCLSFGVCWLRFVVVRLLFV